MKPRSAPFVADALTTRPTRGSLGGKSGLIHWRGRTGHTQSYQNHAEMRQEEAAVEGRKRGLDMCRLNRIGFTFRVCCFAVRVRGTNR